MNTDELKTILANHKLWLANNDGERANLSWVDLRGAIGDGFFTFQAGRHYAVFGGGYGHIGCERHIYQDWLDHYAQIGNDNGYTAAEIERYGTFIKIAVEYLQEVENANTNR